MKKLRFTISLILLLCIALIPQASFAELNKIDSFTGTVDADYDSFTEVIKLSNTCYYDRARDSYVYSTTATEDSDVLCSAFDGMVTTNIVSIEPESNAFIEVYRDGELVEESEYENLKTVGKYAVLSENGANLFSFEIINKISGTIDTFSVPSGFFIYEANLNGAAVRFEEEKVSMKAEGQYEIKYKHSRTGASYTFALETDFTAPELVFTGLDENNVAHGPVGVEAAADVVKTECYKDDEIIGLGSTLKNSGHYEVLVYDEAGNVNKYMFTITPYMNFTAWMAVIALLGIVGGMVGYLMYAKKNLKVR